MVKELLKSSGVLVHLHERLPLVLSCDASPYGVGVVLAHWMPDGLEHPIRFVSRSLSSAEKRYSQSDREALAIIFGVIEVPSITLWVRVRIEDRP